MRLGLGVQALTQAFIMLVCCCFAIFFPSEVALPRAVLAARLAALRYALMNGFLAMVSSFFKHGSAAGGRCWKCGCFGNDAALRTPGEGSPDLADQSLTGGTLDERKDGAHR